MAHAEAIRHLLALVPNAIEFGLGQTHEERLALIRQLTPDAAAAILEILVRTIVSEGYGALGPSEESLEVLMAAPYKGSSGCVLSEDWRLREYVDARGAVYVFTGWPGDVPMGGAVYVAPETRERTVVFDHSNGEFDCPEELDSIVAEYWQLSDLSESD